MLSNEGHPEHIIKKFRNFSSYVDHCPKFFIKESVPMETEETIKTLYKIRSEVKGGVRKSNYKGYQTIDNLSSHKEFDSFIGVLTSFFETNFQTKIKILSMWGNINDTGSFNETHLHHYPGNEFDYFSGVYYLQFEEDMGDLFFSDFITMTHLHVDNIKPCDLVLFPNYMPHYVGPNLSSKDRISIAFNVKIF